MEPNKAKLVDAATPGSTLAKHEHSDLLVFACIIFLLLFTLTVWQETARSKEIERYKPFLCTAPSEIRSPDCITPSDKRIQELERQLAGLKQQQKEKP